LNFLHRFGTVIALRQQTTYYEINASSRPIF
jgi:hypothetical protein